MGSQGPKWTSVLRIVDKLKQPLKATNRSCIVNNKHTLFWNEILNKETHRNDRSRSFRNSGRSTSLSILRVLFSNPEAMAFASKAGSSK